MAPTADPANRPTILACCPRTRGITLFSSSAANWQKTLSAALCGSTGFTLGLPFRQIVGLPPKTAQSAVMTEPATSRTFLSYFACTVFASAWNSLKRSIAVTAMASCLGNVFRDSLSFGFSEGDGAGLTSTIVHPSTVILSCPAPLHVPRILIFCPFWISAGFCSGGLLNLHATVRPGLWPARAITKILSPSGCTNSTTPSTTMGLPPYLLAFSPHWGSSRSFIASAALTTNSSAGLPFVSLAPILSFVSLPHPSTTRMQNSAVKALTLGS